MEFLLCALIVAGYVRSSLICINFGWERNIYGHPAPETLERLADAGCEVYQTPQCGQITFYEKEGVWKLRIYLQ